MYEERSPEWPKCELCQNLATMKRPVTVSIDEHLYPARLYVGSDFFFCSQKCFEKYKEDCAPYIRELENEIKLREPNVNVLAMLRN